MKSVYNTHKFLSISHLFSQVNGKTKNPQNTTNILTSNILHDELIVHIKWPMIDKNQNLFLEYANAQLLNCLDFVQQYTKIFICTNMVHLKHHLHLTRYISN